METHVVHRVFAPVGVHRRKKRWNLHLLCTGYFNFACAGKRKDRNTYFVLHILCVGYFTTTIGTTSFSTRTRISRRRSLLPCATPTRLPVALARRRTQVRQSAKWNATTRSCGRTSLLRRLRTRPSKPTARATTKPKKAGICRRTVADTIRRPRLRRRRFGATDPCRSSVRRPPLRRRRLDEIAHGRRRRLLLRLPKLHHLCSQVYRWIHLVHCPLIPNVSALPPHRRIHTRSRALRLQPRRPPLPRR